MSGKRMTIKETAAYSGLSEYAIRKMCKEGDIPYISIGRRILIDPEAFDEALRIQAIENQQAAKRAVEERKPKEVYHYGKLKDLLG